MRDVSCKFGKVEKHFEVIETPIPHVIIDSETHVRGWYQDKDADKPRTCTSEHFLMTPYRGCVMADGKKVCTFCYLDTMRGYYSMGVVALDKNYPQQLAKDLAELNVGFPCYFSPFCEAFNELEDVYHLTQQAAQVCSDFGLPLMFTTKRAVPTWALDLLQKNKHSSLQVSLNTLDNDLWCKLAPGTANVYTLLTNLRMSKDRKIYTTLRIDPIVSGIIKPSHVKALVDLVVSEKLADHIVFSFAEFGFSTKNKTFEMYDELFPDNTLRSVYNTTQGGNYVVDQGIRMMAFQTFSKVLRGTGITMSTCSELINVDGVLKGVPEFNTSKSCHGIVVPTYVKRGGKFEPLAGCYGACLHCDTQFCGNDRLHQAKANSFADYKKMEVKP